MVCISVLGTPGAAQSYTFANLSNSYTTPSVAVDANGNVYEAVPLANTIYRVSSTGALTVLAGSGIAGSSDGVGTAARFNQPRGIAVDTAGNVYVADTLNATIRKITPAGVVATLAGSAGLRGWDEGQGNVARFETPQGIAVDASGNVYVADTNSRTIRKVTPGGLVSTLAGLGYIAGAVDATGLDARFDQPLGLTVDAAGTVYVADTGNSAIRRITPTGVVTTFAGSMTNPGSADGLGTLARFWMPQALAIDATGNLFVADSANSTIRKITPAGSVITIGGQVGFSGEATGTGGAARFNTPRSVAVGPNGTLYITDFTSLKTGAPSNQLAITVQPQSQSVSAGSSTILTVTATGSGPISYQWLKDGTTIAGATTSTLTLAEVQAGMSAGYTVAVTNPVASVTSATAVLTVLSPLSNDNFANAQILTGSSGQVSGNNNGATGEPGEPTHYYAAATASSVWYRIAPTETGTVVLDITPFMGAAVYTGGTLPTLKRIVQVSSNRLSFAAVAGTTYYIALGSTNANVRGNIVLAWRMIVNDAFAQAIVLNGNSGQAIGNNNGATSESGEPRHYNASGTNTSIWYRWTPSQDAVALIDTAGSSIDTVIAVYSGTQLATLTRVAEDYNTNPAVTIFSGRSRAAFIATGGTTYSIAVGSAGFSAGGIVLNWQLTQSPVITGLVSQPSSPVVRVGDVVTLSVGALSVTPLSYQWQRNSVPIPAATGQTLAFGATPNDTASFRVLVSNNVSSSVSNPISVVVLAVPANDAFTAAQTITGLTGSINGTNVNATGELNEPAHWNASGAASSVWYKWTAPTNGLAAIDTVGSNFDTVLAVYTGTALNNLIRIVQDDDRGGGRTSQVSFAASTGATYYIAVGGSTTGARGNLTLGWQLSPSLAIAAAPINQTIAIGGSATFAVQATGSGVTYQWFRNGVAIPSATNATLTVASVQAGADASYTVAVTNVSGTLISSPATLAVAAPSAATLSVRRTRPEANLLWSIAAGAGELVTVGSLGVILSSPDDGATWTPRSSGTTGWLVAVTYGGGQFVIVGEAGLILTSRDGRSWTQAESSGTTERLNGVIYADGKYVAVGEHGAAVTSPDARVWTPRSTPVNTWLHGLTYHPGIRHFAACGEAGVFLYSPDGITWNRLPVPGYTGALQQTVAVDSYANFVAVGEQGKVVSVRRNELILKDGEPLVTWTAEVLSTNTDAHLVGLVQGAGALFAAGEDGKIITATSDRGPWTTVPSGTNGLLLSGLFHNDTLYIVGHSETVLQSARMFSSRLVNISTRGQVGTGSNVMISGFVITGERAKQVLVRAAGPTLAASFGLSGTLTAPSLELFDGQNRSVASNTGWTSSANNSAISTTAARVGAFPFAANSADSAVVATLNPGSYTAVVSGSNNSTGLSIVEVYDVDPISNDGARAINISTRGVAGSGASKMIAGFVIDGASSRRVLIRAVGPTLARAPFNIGGTLAQPQIELFNNRSLLHATAAAWGLQPNADEIRGAAKSAGAFELGEGSSDSAMVVTLLPGAWTVQVGGIGNTTGVVLVEVYALP